MTQPPGFDLRQLLAIFVAESNERLDGMDEALLALEEDPAAEAPLRELFRIVHTLKGDAGSLGIDDIRTVAHRSEDLIERALDEGRTLSTAAIQALLAATDHVRRRLAEVDTSDPETQGGVAPDSLIAALESAPLEAAVESARPVGDKDRVRGGPAEIGSVRVPISRLDRLFDLAGELLIARGRLRQELLGLPAQVVERCVSELDSTIGLERELQEMLLAARLVKLGPILRSFRRLVRDTASATGKRVRLEIDDTGVELDARVAEVLRGPLAHLVRNAIDHGIEAPERREELGKSPVGRLSMVARHRDGVIRLVIEDDGAGLDVERIRARAVAEGRLDPEALLEGEALTELVSGQGFTTVAEVTEISGRGVGLDAVKDCARQLGGKMELESRPGRGLQVVLELPLTVAIIEAFHVEVDGTALFVPETAVVTCLDSSEPSPGRDGASYLREYDGAALSVIDLGERLGIARGNPERRAVLVVSWNGRRWGLAVDRLDGLGLCIVKPLASSLAGGFGYVGASVLSDGRVGLILDLRTVLEEEEFRAAS